MVLRLLTALTAAVLLAGISAAQAPAAPAKGVSKAQSVKPRWNELTPMQQEALGPLQDQWDTFDSDRKRKWIEVASRYPNLSPEGKQRFHERMPTLAGMTPAQRATARDNFRKAYELPFDQRQSVVEQYKQLPDDKKQELATQPKPRPAEPPRRPIRSPSDSSKESSRKDGSQPGK
jgi:hypothetical protein